MKMRSIDRQQGFTLIEIIIVVVILGILAAIALPRLTSSIDNARAAEAFSVGSTVNKAFDRCLNADTGGANLPVTINVTNCSTWALLGMSDPSTNSTNFSYSLTQPGASTNLRLLATMQAGVSGTAADFVDFTYRGAVGSVAKGCGGKFAKMCKT